MILLKKKLVERKRVPADDLSDMNNVDICYTTVISFTLLKPLNNFPSLKIINNQGS